MCRGINLAHWYILELYLTIFDEELVLIVYILSLSDIVSSILHDLHDFFFLLVILIAYVMDIHLNILLIVLHLLIILRVVPLSLERQ